jgi:hypothetical protein
MEYFSIIKSLLRINLQKKVAERIIKKLENVFFEFLYSDYDSLSLNDLQDLIKNAIRIELNWEENASVALQIYELSRTKDLNLNPDALKYIHKVKLSHSFKV